MNEILADDELVRWISDIRSQPAEAPPLDVNRLRAARVRAAGPSLPVVRDLSVAGDHPVKVRFYRPNERPLPLIVYVHGGAFIFGDLDSHDRTCRRLAVEANAAVLAVHYRRAPENPAPAAIYDVVAALKWAIRPAAILGGIVGSPALAGDSAGGLIALLAARQLVAAGVGLSGLLLVCPNADLTLSQPSVQQKGSGWGLDAAALAWSLQQWVPDMDAERLETWSPLHAMFSGLPPTVIATAEHDPLRDEGTALAQKLNAAATEVHHIRHPGLVHGFLSLDTVSPTALEAGNNLMRKFGSVIRGDHD
ncbi:alpha/beta hydrolase [Pseudarthrobacter sp. H2]|uniref:alpha/beta hydrolase n=1 Tax=Pseudarthrobacter sp. H2 TaxID=3418415 RepID=UPI003CFB1148